MKAKCNPLNQRRERMQAAMSPPFRAEATYLAFGEGNPDAALYFLN
jgi:hypothetical protein